MAVQNPTDNYGWTLPTVDGSDGAWGDLLNTLLGDPNAGNEGAIDTVIKAVSDTASAAMPKLGGTFTGEIKILTEIFTVSAMGNVSDGGTPLAMDLDAANVFTATVTGAVTQSFTNVPATGSAVLVQLILTDGGTNVTWDSAIDWPGGSAPTLQESGVDILTFVTVDGGTTWHGMLASSDSS